MRPLPLLGAATLIAMPAGAWALGLGNIALHSALNEPFRAEIALVDASPQELQALKVGLASPETFDRYGLDRPADLSALEFHVGKNSSGQDVILVSSKARIDDPFVTMLVEITWPRGRLLREYTVLLDPPVLLSGRSEQAAVQPTQTPAQPSGSASAPIERPSAAAAPPAAAAAGIAASSPSVAGAQPRTPEPTTPAATPSTATANVQGSTPGTYGPVRDGDTLWDIASTLKPTDVTTNQMMMALYRANPNAFQDNINLLNRGATLSIPAHTSLLASSRAEATAQVRQQAELWKQRSGATVAAAGAAAGSDAAADPTAAARLRLVPPKSQGTVGAGEGAQAGAQGGQAGAAGNAAEVASLRNEVSSLRTQLEQKQRLLELKDSQLQALQNQVQNSQTGGASQSSQEPLAATAPGVELESTQVADTDTGTGTGTKTEAEVAAEVAPAATATVPEAASAAQAAVAATDAENSVQENAATPTEPSATSDAEQAAASTPAQAATNPVVAAPQLPAVSEPSLFSRIVGWVANPLLLIGLGLAAVLLTAIWYMRFRREDEEDVTGRWDALEAEIEEESRAATGRFNMRAEESMTSSFAAAAFAGRHDSEGPGEVAEDVADEVAPALEALTDHRETVGEAAEDHSSSSQSMISFEPTDPLAEADFHMAYGLYDQAAEIISKATEAQPQRHDLKLKLLEVFFVWGNKDGFLEAAQNFHSEVGAGKEWDKILIMGKQICPDEPLFEGAGDGGAVDVDLEGDSLAEIDFDFDADHQDDDAIDLDFGSARSGTNMGLALAATGEFIADRGGDDETSAGSRDDDDAAGYRGFNDESLSDLGEPLDIGTQTAASLEEALFMEGDDEADEANVAEEHHLQATGSDGYGYDSLAATQESPTGLMSPYGAADADWESPLDETSGNTHDIETGRYSSADGDHLDPDTASTGTFAPPDMDALAAESPTVETPTMEAAYGVSRGFGKETFNPVDALSDTSTSESRLDPSEEIELEDLGLTADELDELGTESWDLSDDSEAGSSADDGSVLETDDDDAEREVARILAGSEADDEISMSLPEFDNSDFETVMADATSFQLNQFANTDISGTDIREHAHIEEDQVEQTDIGRDIGRTGSVGVDPGATEILPSRDPSLALSHDDDDDSERTSRHRSFEDFDLGDERSDDLGLDLDELSRALEGGDTVERPLVVGAEEDSLVDAGSRNEGFDATLRVSRVMDPADDEPMGALDPDALTEVGTKIDLARAYIDMGDPDGARSILEEVLDEGDVGQRHEAQGLIDVLSA